MKLRTAQVCGTVTGIVLFNGIAWSGPISLANKTCSGTYMSAEYASEDTMGALLYKFQPSGTSLIANVWRTQGRIAYDRLNAEIETRKLSNDMRGFVYAGNFLNVAVDGDHVTFASTTGNKYDLRFDGEQLSGTGDPRGVPGQEHWSVANIRLLCR